MIEVQGVSKSYGTLVALNRVSFSVRENEVLGFLGPNGAGKSTAMKIITTYLSPDEGRVTVDGIDVTADPLAARNRIGYLPETAPLYDDMRVSDYVRFVAQARGLEGGALKERLDWVYEATGIRSELYKNVNELSKGYRQRVGLAQALVHDPHVLILDEPTSGLDPHQIVGIRNLIHDLAKTKTIIFSTHILGEVSAVTNRIAIINGGEIVADGYIDDLRRQAKRENRYRVSFGAGDGGTGGADAALRDLSGVTGVALATGNGATGPFIVSCSVDRDLRKPISDLARDRGWDLLELHPLEPTLEEAFIALTKGGSAVA